MKVLLFHIGRDRYGLPLARIVRVLPLLELKQLPLTPDYVAGLMDLHGTPVPVIDLSRLAGLPAAAAQFDTRIVVVDYRAPGGETMHALGLLASQVRGIADIDPLQLEDSGVATVPFLGQVASDADGIVQLVELEHLLPPDVRALLFQDAGAA
ncbi:MULTISPECIES: chemotaxis protein CheW [unclassified Janthinobacterium]|uniref:chemotaxis protein CheW n=1 Tax=unclassified Janthinobacterium TaxID=2610881 RepID=UPI001E2B9A1F|nr:MULTISPECIES: chemotaxis protein CheW [unclassified Janthinobacterium]MCC7646305.1 purine-binding chemotaxis protein CheW [Janthinobacterium sp. EB271-G4-3-1]MCC7694778.1 purine-binding chemotaxis protein CheW [Janthinobacterium sp. EB271-G4-3-2]